MDVNNAHANSSDNLINCLAVDTDPNFNSLELVNFTSTSETAQPTSSSSSSSSNPYKRQANNTDFQVKPPKLVVHPCENGNAPLDSQYIPAQTTPALPDVDALLLNCESYMNWQDGSKAHLTEDNLKRQIENILRQNILPSEKYEYANLARFNALEYISNLGVLCYYYIELNNFEEAACIISKTREFVIPCIRNGYMPEELIDSFDYVWVYVRVHASIKEWEITGKMNSFPEIDLTNIPKSFDSLTPKAKAGVLGLKYYFYKWQKVPYDIQIEILKMATLHDRHYFEWHLCLQLSMRQKRKGINFASAFFRTYAWDEEINEICLANKLQPAGHPRCLLASIQLLADIAKFMHAKDPKWTVLKFGDVRFPSMISVKSYIQEESAKILSLCPKSVDVPTSLAEIFSTGLPIIHRNQSLAKECLDLALKNYPDSVKVNYRLGMFYLTVESNYVKAEEFFRQTYALDEKFYPGILSLVQILMRKKQKDGIMELLDKALNESHWNNKQLGGFHFFRGLLLCSDSLSKSKAAADEFVKCYQLHEKSLTFYDLPNIHRRYGWPHWEDDTKLTYESIRQRVKRVELAGIDPTRKSIFAKILQAIDMAALSENKSSSVTTTKSRWHK